MADDPEASNSNLVDIDSANQPSDTSAKRKELKLMFDTSKPTPANPPSQQPHYLESMGHPTQIRRYFSSLSQRLSAFHQRLTRVMSSNTNSTSDDNHHKSNVDTTNTALSAAAADCLKPSSGGGFTAAWKQRVYGNTSISAPNSPAYNASRVRHIDPGGGRTDAYCARQQRPAPPPRRPPTLTSTTCHNRDAQDVTHGVNSGTSSCAFNFNSFDDSMDIIMDKSSVDRNPSPISGNPSPNRPNLTLTSPTPRRPRMDMSPTLSTRSSPSPRRPSDMSPRMFPRRTSPGGADIQLSSTCLPLNSSPRSFAYTSPPTHTDPTPAWRRNIERLRSHNLGKEGKLQITPDLIFDFTADDLQDMGEIGRGAFGTVNKMRHVKSDTIMAVKRIRSTVDEKEQKQLLMDLDVVMRSNECKYIVQFYGALFKEGDCWICMELMAISLDKLYKFVHGPASDDDQLPEHILGRIASATTRALSYLKEKLKIMHRDVKPSNILLDTSGNIKLCDFGISGQLVDSIAKTRDAGCRPYMAPERIDPKASQEGYDVRSDVWSLGITLVEIATGKFPYPKWNSVFDQLTQVVRGDPPHLDIQQHPQFSREFIEFVNTCLIKDQERRPKYNKLLKLKFIVHHDSYECDVAGYVQSVINKMPESYLQLDTSSGST